MIPPEGRTQSPGAPRHLSVGVAANPVAAIPRRMDKPCGFRCSRFHNSDNECAGAPAGAYHNEGILAGQSGSQFHNDCISSTHFLDAILCCLQPIKEHFYGHPEAPAQCSRLPPSTTVVSIFHCLLEERTPLHRRDGIDQVLPGDEQHESNKQCHADQMHQSLFRRIHPPASDPFHNHKQNTSPIQCGEG